MDKTSQAKKEISFQKLLAKTCSSPEENFVSTENYLPTDETYENNQENFMQTFSKVGERMGGDHVLGYRRQEWTSFDQLSLKNQTVF